MSTLSLPAVSLDLLLRWAESRDETDRMFGTLTPSALYSRPIAERHRVLFYMGHLEAFDWNLLREHLTLDRFRPEYDRLFAFGIDPVDGGLPKDQPSHWPHMAEVLSYRSRVRQQLDAALAGATETQELIQLLNIAIEHRLMHAETLEYMFHQLPYEAKIRPESAALPAAPKVVPEMVKIPGGSVVLGLDRASGQFGWDNEFEGHKVDVPAFSIDRHKVTNARFLQFIEAGGYRQPALWPPADWEWISGAGVSHPVFWVAAASGFRYQGMFEEMPLPLDAPVYVSQAEAAAFARWCGKTLPTEAEWQRAAEGARPPRESRKLQEPQAVGISPEFASSFGVEDLYGTGWEWTSTPFQPFPGFRIVDAYPGYSANFFDGKHYVMKGGSTRTAACMLRKTFRNWFQAHYQYVYAGFRCVA
jgi:iron(II)-dependent oxidoreductase